MFLSATKLFLAGNFYSALTKSLHHNEHLLYIDNLPSTDTDANQLLVRNRLKAGVSPEENVLNTMFLTPDEKITEEVKQSHSSTFATFPAVAEHKGSAELYSHVLLRSEPNDVLEAWEAFPEEKQPESSASSSSSSSGAFQTGVKEPFSFKSMAVWMGPLLDAVDEPRHVERGDAEAKTPSARRPDGNSSDNFALGGAGSVVKAIPIVGNLLAIPATAAQMSNQVKMRHRDELISQLFSGARSIEQQVAQLAEQMTIAIRQELLEDKPWPERLKAQQKGNKMAQYYEQFTGALSQKKAEWLNWQTLTPAQQKARIDAGYLFEQLPGLVTHKIYRGSSVSTVTYLRILLHIPNFVYDESVLLAGIQNLPRQAMDRPKRQAGGDAAKYQHHMAKKQNCVEQLNARLQQPMTTASWQQLQPVLTQLETHVLELEPLY